MGFGRIEDGQLDDFEAGLSGNKTLEHHAVQMAVAAAARSRGWEAAVEDRRGGTVGDVSLTSPDGAVTAVEVQLADQSDARTLARTLKLYADWQRTLPEGDPMRGLAPFTLREIAPVLGRKADDAAGIMADLRLALESGDPDSLLAGVADGWDWSDTPLRQEMTSSFRVLWLFPDRGRENPRENGDGRPCRLMNFPVGACPAVSLRDIDPSLPSWAKGKGMTERRIYRSGVVSSAVRVAEAAMDGRLAPADMAVEENYSVCPLLARSPGMGWGTAPALGDHHSAWGAWFVPSGGGTPFCITLDKANEILARENPCPQSRAVAEACIEALNKGLAVAGDDFPPQAVMRCSDGVYRCLVPVPESATPKAHGRPISNAVKTGSTVGLAAACDPIAASVAEEAGGWKGLKDRSRDVPLFAACRVSLPRMQRGWTLEEGGTATLLRPQHALKVVGDPQAMRKLAEEAGWTQDRTFALRVKDSAIDALKAARGSALVERGYAKDGDPPSPITAKQVEDAARRFRSRRGRADEDIAALAAYTPKTGRNMVPSVVRSKYSHGSTRESAW